jgi:hypothetical protein
LPQWSRRAWESLLTLLPIAIKNEQIIKQVNYFYNQLDKITAICKSLSQAIAELSLMERREVKGTPGDSSEVFSHFQFLENLKKKISKQWMECEEVIRNVLDSENPFQK